MKHILIVCCLIAGLTFPGCAANMQADKSLNNLTDEEIEAYNSDPNNTDKIVCTEEAAIGSRISKRVCRKESAMDARSRQDQQALDRIQAGGIQNTRKDGGN